MKTALDDDPFDEVEPRPGAFRRLTGQAAAFLAAGSLGIMAGFFFAFSNPTMPGLAAVDAVVFIPAMQEINLAVRNGVFFLAFFGPLLFCGLALVFTKQNLIWIIALGLYGAAFGITIEVNVPINEAMALWSPSSPPANWAETRDTWIQANHLRATLSFLAFLIALVGVHVNGVSAGRADASRGA